MKLLMLILAALLSLFVLWKISGVRGVFTWCWVGFVALVYVFGQKFLGETAGFVVTLAVIGISYFLQKAGELKQRDIQKH